MATKKVGVLIKEARTKAGLSQEALAKQIDGLSASELGKAERGEKDLTNEQLKAIAKATGVTQKSLLEAPKNVSSGKKTTSSTAKKTTTTSTAKKTTSSAKKTTDEGVKLTASEKKFLELYRAANSDTRKTAEKILKGEQDGLLELLLSSAGNTVSGLLGGAGGSVAELLSGFLKK